MFRTRMIQTASLVAGLLLVAGSFAQVPSDAPAGTTGLCKDGSYSSAASKKGACSGHKGVKTWYVAAPSDSGTAPTAGPPPKTMTAPATAPSASPPPATMAAPATAPAVTPPPATMAAPATAPVKSSTGAPAAAAAPGGGPGLVLVNTSSKVYHCQSDRYYGKTKSGAYMSEADAKAAGNRPDHGKPCS
jgi:hypothetical protein